MEDDLGIESLNIPSIQLPDNIDIPLKHEQPKTTLDSLNQIRNEFSAKLQEAKEKNDSSKKRRYERQLKQFEDAIKATREGKQYDYTQLTVPPGFASIPLQNGKPILGNSSGSSSNRASQQVQKNISPPPSTIKTSPKKIDVDTNEEASDDLLEQLENEIDENDLDLDDDGLDPEDDHIRKQLSSIMPNIKKLVPKDDMMDDFEQKTSAYLIPEPTVPRPNRTSNSQLPKSNSKQNISPPQPQSQQAPKAVSPPNAAQAAAKPKIQSKELTIIHERQRLFKEAALKAKQEGNVNVALVYLRHAKGFESMILAAENGLPLDMSNLPVPPQLAEKQKALNNTSPPNKNLGSAVTTQVLNEAPISGDRKAVFMRLQEDLMQQIKVATANFKHFTNMGDISNANKFNQIARESIQDLDALKSAYTHGEQVPLYHYEKRSYQTIDCNSDLTDNDLEITIVRAINLPLPKDFEAKHLTTYVKFEFPYPPEQAQVDKTNKQSGTLNPEYNQAFKILIQRKQTKFMRLMNRKELKCEVYYKAGLLKGDKLLATSMIKLQPLENTSTLHDAFDLFDGRRQLGAKLEVKIRIREPLLHKEVKTLEQRWLIIDKFNSIKTVAL